MNVVLLVLGVVVSTKAFSFHNRSSSNFAHRLVITLSTIVPCRILKLSPNQLIIINVQSSHCLYTAASAAAAAAGHTCHVAATPGEQT